MTTNERNDGSVKNSFNEALELTTVVENVLRINVWCEEADLDDEPTAIIDFKKNNGKYIPVLSQTVTSFDGFHLDELQKLTALMKSHKNKLEKFEKSL